MDLAQQVHIFGISITHIYEPNITPIRLFSLIFNYANLDFYNKYNLYEASTLNANMV